MKSGMVNAQGYTLGADWTDGIIISEEQGDVLLKYFAAYPSARDEMIVSYSIDDLRTKLGYTNQTPYSIYYFGIYIGNN